MAGHPLKLVGAGQALPAAVLRGFVKSLARRIAGFPASGLAVIKERVNAVTLAPAADFRRDSSLFIDGVRNPEAQRRIKAAMKRGFQTREPEMALARMLADLAAPFNHDAGLASTQEETP
jgi:hypothetical protein